jgi:dGTPase
MEIYKRYLDRPPNPDEHKSRSEVAKDRDRIVHSGALRRLQSKSQIVGVQSNDFFRTRLTHTIECAQVGRAIALRSLKSPDLRKVVRRKDHLPDLVEAACYAHDLGHPPFGHNGERALRKLMESHGRGMFEGNAQSFRIVTQLEPKVYEGDTWFGLNLTRTTLKAMMKYPKTENEAKTDRETKFCVYSGGRDETVYDWMYKETVGRRKPTLATNILDAADDIAYAVHDFEDGVWAGMIPLDRLLDKSDPTRRDELTRFLNNESPTLFPQPKTVASVLRPLLALPASAAWARRPFDRSTRAGCELKDFSAKLIGDFIEDVTPYDAFVEPSGETAQRLALLKAMARIWMIDAPAQATLRYGQQKLIHDLFTGYWRRPEMLPQRDELGQLPPPENEDFESSGEKVGSPSDGLSVYRAKARLICDHIAAMTDLYALHAHAEMHGGGAAPNLRLV